MSSGGDRVPVICPACSPNLETVHEILSPGPGSLTVRCGECGHVHKIQPEQSEEVTLHVVVSQGGESFTAGVTTPADETIAIGDEFVLETAEILATVRVTGVELEGDRRVEEAAAPEVETVWTREVDNVSINVTIHPADGSRAESSSATYMLPGDYDLEVGAVESIDGDEFEIDALVVRDVASGYDRDRYEHEGDVVLAKDVKRVYAFDTSNHRSTPW